MMMMVEDGGRQADRQVDRQAIGRQTVSRYGGR